MSAKGSKLDRKADAVIAALLTEPTHAAAAKAAGVSEATLQRWLKLPEFQLRYKAARRELVEGTLAKLQGAGAEAVDVLRACLTSERPGDRIRAATAVLDQLLRYRDGVDHEDRIARLEAQLGGPDPAPPGVR